MRRAVYAVLALLGAAGCFSAMFAHLPGLLLWFVLHGWGKAAFYGVVAAANLAIGIGLWRMQEWARRLALAVLGFGAVQTVIDLLRPALVMQISAEIHQAMRLPGPPVAAQMGGAIHVMTFSTSLLVLLAVAVMLHHYRGRFAGSGGAPMPPPGTQA